MWLWIAGTHPRRAGALSEQLADDFPLLDDLDRTPVGGNVFLGGLTPSQTGGGPAQLYALMHAGVRARVAIIASLVSWLGTIIFFLIAGVSLMAGQSGVDLPSGYRFFSGATVVVFSTIVAIFLFALPKPTVYRGRLRATLAIVPVWGKSWSQSGEVQSGEAP